MPPTKKRVDKSAAAAAAPVRAAQPKAIKKRRLVDLSKLRKPGSSGGEGGSSRGGKSSSFKKSTATWSLVRAKYQKGDKTGEYSGAIYYRGKPRYGQNEAYKQLAAKHLLTERLRWNDELKLYTARVYAAGQARSLLTAFKELEGGEADLPEDIEESVFDEATPAEVLIFPITVHEGPTSKDQDMLAVSGTTFPFKDELKTRGFSFHTTVNDEDGVNLWLAPHEEVDEDAIAELFKEYGFEVDVLDGVGDEDDVEDEDA